MLSAIFAAIVSMDPDAHAQVVSISAAILFSVFTFILGFLINLLAMRAMFVSSKSCEDHRVACAKCNEAVLTGINTSVKRLESLSDNHGQCLTRLHGLISAIAVKLNIGKQNG